MDKKRNCPILRARILNVPAEQLYISAITLFEFMKGASNAALGYTGPDAHASYEHWLGQYRALAKFQVLPYTETAEKRFWNLPPAIRQKNPRDKRIGCSAVAAGYTLVTRNVQHFTDIPGLVTEDWNIDPRHR